MPEKLKIDQQVFHKALTVQTHVQQLEKVLRHNDFLHSSLQRPVAERNTAISTGRNDFQVTRRHRGVGLPTKCDVYKINFSVQHTSYKHYKKQSILFPYYSFELGNHTQLFLVATLSCTEPVLKQKKSNDKIQILLSRTAGI